MTDIIEKRRSFIINTGYFVLVGAIIFLAIKYSLLWLTPFIIGFIVASILRPIIKKIQKNFRLGHKPLAALVVLVFYGTIGLIVGLLSVKLFLSMKDLFIWLPNYYTQSVEPVFIELLNWTQGWFAALDPELLQSLSDISSNLISSIATLISRFSSGMVSFISSGISSVPNFFVSLVFAIISSFFFAIDYPAVTNFLGKQLTAKQKETLIEIKETVGKTLINFVKAYSIIMGITFLEISLGLSLLKVENAFYIAAIIAVLDVLPALGSGGVLIPWAIIQMLKSNWFLGIGLLILYVVVLVVRNIIEPKVVGGRIGLPPIIMLMCMFAGVKIFGILGLFILPIVVIIIKELNESGKIRVFK